ncbi:MAG: hypothetical protein Kilf2KO_00930 [Rhodospirillales bacterium]
MILAGFFLVGLPAGGVAAQLQPVEIDVNINAGQKHRLSDVKLTIEPYRKESDIEAPVSLSGPGKVSLPEGRYVLRAQLDQLVVEELFQVSGPTNHVVVLDVGFATLALIPQIGANPYRRNVAWRVMTWRKDRQGNRKLLAVLTGARPRIALPEGFYMVEATHGGTETRHTIEISRGRTYDYTLIKK